MIGHSEREVSKEIKRLKNKGYSVGEVKTKLKKSGLNKSLINKGIKNHNNNHKKKKETVHKLFGEVHSHGKAKYEDGKAPELIVVFIFFVLGLSILTILLTSPQLCKDDSCFLEKANNCDEVLFHKEVGNVLFSYYANGCQVTKRVERVNFGGEVSRLMKDKEMSCFYNKGEFDESLLNSLGGNLDKCSGSYKNVYIFLSDNM